MAKTSKTAHFMLNENVSKRLMTGGKWLKKMKNRLASTALNGDKHSLP